MTLTHALVSAPIRASGWVTTGRRHDAPVKPDRILRLDPAKITYKPVEKPTSRAIPPTLVAGGEWDRDLVPIRRDPVFRCLRKRFIDGKTWEASGYIEYLKTDDSEHRTSSRETAYERCRHLDELYRTIEAHGYRSQAALAENGDHIDELTNPWRPLAYREVAVNITRGGTFIWHAGMHRLVIAKLLDIPQIPVRVNTRHHHWQVIRDAAVRGEDIEAFRDHPDVVYLLEDT